MSLELPADAEPFLQDAHNFKRLRGAAVYALTLTRPENIGEVWDRYNDNRPDYWEELTDADGVVYVGAAKDLLARLSDHKDGEHRVPALMKVCEIDGLRNVWWVDSPDRRFIEESKLATMLQNERPDLYVHSR
jgi:predicted GIY-YIG superfamily endonuclease